MPLDTKRKSTLQEKRVAKELGGRVTPASGALWGAKADVRNDQFLVECKTTSKDHYVLNYSTWEKIRHEALRDGFREPVMCIDLLDGKHRLAVLDYTINTDYASRLPASLLDLSYNYCNGSSRSIKWSNITRTLTFCNKRFLSNKNAGNKDIELLLTPWESFCDYLNELDKECE